MARQTSSVCFTGGQVPSRPRAVERAPRDSRPATLTTHKTRPKVQKRHPIVFFSWHRQVRARSCLIVLGDVLAFGSSSLLGGFAMGRLLAWSSLGPMTWQWLEEATALPRVGLLDGPECRGKAEQARRYTGADEHHPSLPILAISSLLCGKSKKPGHAEPTIHLGASEMCTCVHGETASLASPAKESGKCIQEILSCNESSFDSDLDEVCRAEKNADTFITVG